MPEWVEVRCPSPACDREGGRVLFKRCGDLYAHFSRNSRIISTAPPSYARCHCGHLWQHPDLKRVDALIHEEIA